MTWGFGFFARTATKQISAITCCTQHHNYKWAQQQYSQNHSPKRVKWWIWSKPALARQSVLRFFLEMFLAHSTSLNHVYFTGCVLITMICILSARLRTAKPGQVVYQFTFTKPHNSSLGFVSCENTWTQQELKRLKSLLSQFILKTWKGS